MRHFICYIIYTLLCIFLCNWYVFFENFVIIFQWWFKKIFLLDTILYYVLGANSKWRILPWRATINLLPLMKWLFFNQYALMKINEFIFPLLNIFLLCFSVYLKKHWVEVLRFWHISTFFFKQGNKKCKLFTKYLILIY